VPVDVARVPAAADDGAFSVSSGPPSAAGPGERRPGGA
jgi:hypothetical protein